MIRKEFQKGDAASYAEYSACGTYRYSLTRLWDEAAPRVAFVMMNPSKATERDNDPTIERCERRARALGFGGFRAVNIFALRETDPAKLRKHPAPEGEENADAVLAASDWADQVIAAWGAHGDLHGQGTRVRDMLFRTGRPIHCLGVTKHGHPRHPLYIAYAQHPVLWNMAGKTC